MLKITVLDINAEARTRIISILDSFQAKYQTSTSSIVSFNAVPISLEEVRFHDEPDIFLLGHSLLESEQGVIAKLRKLYPATTILVEITPDKDSLEYIEDLTRAGADDVVNFNEGADIFFKKLVIHSRKKVSKGHGTLILVDAAKGGLGVTSVAAGLAEVISLRGKKTLLVDLGYETQDLSRFMRAKPYINENLQSITQKNRQPTEDFVSQCIVPIWQEEELYCMPPVPKDDPLFMSKPDVIRIFLAVLERLDEMFDFIVVDMGDVKGMLTEALYRVADTVFFLTNNDAAALFATVSKVSYLRRLISPSSNIYLLEYAPIKHGLSSSVMRQEITLALGGDVKWVRDAIPYSIPASRWPGSGDTIYSLSPKSFAKKFATLIDYADSSFTDNLQTRSSWLSIVKGVLSDRKALPYHGKGSVQRMALDKPSTSRYNTTNVLPESVNSVNGRDRHDKELALGIKFMSSIASTADSGNMNTTTEEQRHVDSDAVIEDQHKQHEEKDRKQPRELFDNLVENTEDSLDPRELITSANVAEGGGG